MRWIRFFRDIGRGDVSSVGGKNASLGEMRAQLAPEGVNIPDGFAITAGAYREFIRAAQLEAPIRALLSERPREHHESQAARCQHVRDLIETASFPRDMEEEIVAAYRALSAEYGVECADVAVRSSATAEDLPTASFAGQQESYLNIVGPLALLDAVRRDFASLFSPRAINYQRDMGFDPTQVALSVGVQKMVRSDLASSGVIFTLEPESGHQGVVLVTSSWGLGENVVQGRVQPDQFVVHKQMLREGYRPIVRRQLGAKESTLVYDETGSAATRDLATSPAARARWSLSDDEVLTLARWSLLIERHYSTVSGAPAPMDIEWAKDGQSGKLYIVQARPETVHSQRSLRISRYSLKQSATPLASGLAIGDRIACGPVHVIRDASGIGQFTAGELLVTGVTDPDWEPIMRLASAIVTEKGGRTSHAAIVARELGIPALVGAENAMTLLVDGTIATVSCAQGETGYAYAGAIPYDVDEIDPGKLDRPRTQMMLNLGNPEQAFSQAMLPSDGVGLARMEFIFAGWVKIHPLALTRYATQPRPVQAEIDALTLGYPDKSEYFVDRLAQGIGTLAAAFHPRPVILRFSDFKTNEYSKLTGGAPFEPTEENPMLGWRGASRYYHPNYREGFLLEVAAVRRVREVYGFKNLKVMVPFCRTPREGEQVLSVMREGGLVSGKDGLEVYVMAEIPSNIILADEFSELFDGFSIGSNDLTQLTLGIDRDSAAVAPLFDERNPAILWSCARLIEIAHKHGRKVGICGQAPSDYPEFAAYLVKQGIDSISLNADALLRTTLQVLELEKQPATKKRTPRKTGRGHDGERERKH